MRRARTPAAALAIIAVLGLTACGGDGGDTSAAPPPEDLDAAVSGTLRVFAYQDTVTDELMDPFRRQNPELEVKTATFGSNQEAAAKLAGGFEADVVEVCLDEMRPLTARGLLRPVDPAGIPDWDELVFRDAEGVRDGDDALVVPLSAGPQGLIYDTDEVKAAEVESFGDLFDPAFADRVALEADYPLPAIAETALALGIEDPMNLTPEELEQVKQHLIDHRDQFRSLWRSDADVVNLFRSGEIVLADGGPGLTQRVRDTGVNAEWVAPVERPLSWVCGLAITSDSANIPAAYALINWQASPEAQAIRADSGYVVTNPAAIELAAPASRRTADPASIENAIPETEPPRYDEWVRAFNEFEAD
ncbi:MAG: ABC transporter substrate-binding protein [Solirubrobacterales bacterium]